jgi:hypothetical protein
MSRALVFISLIAALAAQASPTGRPTGGVSCQLCHSQAEPPELELVGPTQVPQNKLVTYQLIIRGGAGVVGGMNAAAPDESIELFPGEGLKLMGRELVQSAPKTFDENDELRFEFQLRASEQATQLLLRLAANSANGDGTPNGDGASAIKRWIDVVPPEAEVDAGVELDAGTEDPQNSDGGIVAEGPIDADQPPQTGCSSGVADFSSLGLIALIFLFMKRVLQARSSH